MSQRSTVTRQTAEPSVSVRPSRVSTNCGNDGPGQASGAQPVRLRWLPIGQALPFRAFNDERSPCAVGHLARVVAERKLVAVAAKMPDADVMERSDDAALQ